MKCELFKKATEGCIDEYVTIITLDKEDFIKSVTDYVKFKKSGVLRKIEDNRKFKMCGDLGETIRYLLKDGYKMRYKKLKLTDDQYFEIARADISAGVYLAIEVLEHFGGNVLEYYAGLAGVSDDNYDEDILALRDYIYKSNGIDKQMEEAYDAVEACIANNII